MPTDNTPVAELMRVLPTYNTVGAMLEGYEGNIDLWRSDLNTVADWYFEQTGG